MSSTSPGTSYDTSLRNALRRAKDLDVRLEIERSAAPQLLEELLASPDNRRTLTINRPAYRTLGFFLYVKGWAIRLPPRDPSFVLELSGLALASLDLVDPQTYFLTPALLADHRATLLAARGNALRLQAEFTQAEKAFSAAWHASKRVI